MIRNELEFKRILARVTEHHLQLVDQRERLQQAGHSEEQIEHMLGSLIASCQRLKDEVASYDRRIARTWVPA